MVVDASEGTGTCSLGRGDEGIQTGLKCHRTGSLEVSGNLRYLHESCMLTVFPATVFSLLFYSTPLSKCNVTRGEAIHESL